MKHQMKQDNAKIINTIKKHWLPLAKITSLPKNNKEYERLLDILNHLLDMGGSDETNALAPLVEIIGCFIERYEEERYATLDHRVDAADNLRFLMKQHQLKQSDLEKEIGKQSIVSNILNRRRQLNARQIARLSKRFNVSSDLFMAKMRN